MDNSLRVYAEHLLAGTGIDLDRIADLAGTDTTRSATAEAVRAGWETAAAPIPDLPIAPEITEQEEEEL